MPKSVKATDGDTLCGLAIDAGFLDCGPLRAEPANSAFLTRDLQAGDIVTIPDLATKDESKPSETTNVFEIKTAPAILVRFTHGTPDKHYREDPTLTFLNVSNFVSNKCGQNGQHGFPTKTPFDQNAHVDPDSFKIEVVDPSGPQSVQVLLEPMKPVFAADGSVSGHELFEGDEHDLRMSLINCVKVPSAVCYRSPYMRLVTDDLDFTNSPNGQQMVLVTDMADGNGGDADRVEILDQLVRVSYKRKKCPAADPNKCTARATIEIGPRRQRVRMAVHVFRTAPGTGSPVVGGFTKPMIRRRVFKWFRRTYAQAELAPKLAGPEVEFLDPPPANMLVISQNHGRAALGGSTLSFTLSQPPPVGSSASDPTVSLPLTPGMTPREVGDAVVKAVLALGEFNAEAFTNARAFDAPNGSCDVLITRADGARVAIRNEGTTDTGLGVADGVRVARPDINSINTVDTFASRIPSHEDYRRIVRAAPGVGDRLEIYVVGGFQSPTLGGRAIVWGHVVPDDFQGKPPMRFCALIRATSDPASGASGGIMDGSDDFFNILAHESAHTLADVFHASEGEPLRKTELLFNNAPKDNEVTAAKRICDVPLLLKYEIFDPVQKKAGDFTNARINLVERLREVAGPTLEDW